MFDVFLIRVAGRNVYVWEEGGLFYRILISKDLFFKFLLSDAQNVLRNACSFYPDLKGF